MSNLCIVFKSDQDLILFFEIVTVATEFCLHVRVTFLWTGILPNSSLP